MYSGSIRILRRMPIPRTRATSALLLLAVSLPFLFAHLGFPLLDPDEGLYASIPREMLVGHDWVVPHVNGIPYIEKPPLYFWLTAAAMAVFGTADWVPRLWAALSALGTVLLTWRIGRRLHDDTAGVIAGVALATCVGEVLFVRRASTDMVFTACLTLAMYGFVRDAERPDRGRTRFILVYLGAALAVLAKGLVGVVFVVVILVVAMAWTRRLRARDLNLARGALLFLAVTLPWHVAVAWRSGTLFWFYTIDNHVLRFLNARTFREDDVPISTVGFFVATFLWVFPWGVFVLGRPRATDDRDAGWRVVPVVWAAAVLGLFALSRFKHEYYGVPAFPALAILAGAAWASARDIGVWLRIALAGCGVVGAWAIWVGARLTPDQALWGLAQLNVYYRMLREQGIAFPFSSPRPLGHLLEALGVTLIVGWTAAAIAWTKGARRVALACVLGVAAFIAVLLVDLLDVVEAHHAVAPLARAIVARAGPDDAVVYEGDLEYAPSLPFYTGRRVLLVNGALGYFEFASRLPESRGVFLGPADLAALWNGPHRVFLVIREPGLDSVVHALPTEHVHALGRFGSRALFSNR